MKRYELKDKERQAAFEKVFPGFGRLLNEACSVCPTDTVVHISSHGVAGQDFPHFYELSFPRSIIEEVVAYDPKGWNKYPEVTPPEGVWMRVETWNACGSTVRGVFMYTGGAWRRSKYTDPQNEIKAARFRPWDEEDEDE